jgi:prepilin peptidase CpaA
LAPITVLSILPTYLCLAGFLIMLGLAAFKDLRERRIPNRLTGGLAALYPVYVLVSPTPVVWPAALGLAVVVFVIGLGLFARELIGGGDVKLIAALSLWAGPEQFVWFMLVTTLTGGALSLIGLWYRRWGGLIEGHLATRGLAIASNRVPALPDATSEKSAVRSTTLPYGVAIAAGGIAIIIELAKL